MKRLPILCLMVSLLWVASGVAQPHGVIDIRKVDFLNFSYSSSLCSQEYGKEGIGKTVSVHDGEFKNKNVYFSVTGDRILYADMTGDGHEDAVVPVDCGAITANYSLSEIHVFTIKDGHATLLAQLTDKEMEQDYRRHFKDAESYWGIDADGLKAEKGHLKINVLADGSHAAPQYIVTLDYGLSGKTLRLTGKPQRKSLQ